jgi:hypothetical protein
MERDLEHLKLLSIFHYVIAGMVGLVSCFPILDLVIGLVFMFGGDEMFGNGIQPHEPVGARVFGFLFTAFAAVFILGGWTMATLIAFAGRNLSRQTHYTYCMVVAGCACVFVPVGTVLGVFTIFVLVRPSVKELFDSYDSAESVVDSFS